MSAEEIKAIATLVLHIVETRLEYRDPAVTKAKIDYWVEKTITQLGAK